MDPSLIIGAAFVDLIVNVPSLPLSGGDVTGELKSYNVGGSAFNVYGAIRYTKSDADLFVPIGTGQYANIIRRRFSKSKFPLKLSVTGADNGWDISFVEPGGERSFLTIQGIEQLWQPEWFDWIDVNQYKYFYISGYELENKRSANVILQALSKRRSDSYLLFDASPRIGHIPQETVNRLLVSSVIIHCNQTEMSGLMPDGTNIDEKAAAIYRLTNSPVIVTLGSRGTYYYNGSSPEIIDGERANVINTIGAGDAHCGGLLAGLSRGWSMKEAIRLANHLSSLAVAQQSSSLC